MDNGQVKVEQSESWVGSLPMYLKAVFPCKSKVASRPLGVKQSVFFLRTHRWLWFRFRGYSRHFCSGLRDTILMKRHPLMESMLKAFKFGVKVLTPRRDWQRIAWLSVRQNTDQWHWGQQLEEKTVCDKVYDLSAVEIIDTDQLGD